MLLHIGYDEGAKLRRHFRSLAEPFFETGYSLMQQHAEAIVHPLVRRKEVETIAEAQGSGADMIVLDIPLLYESGTESRVDKVVVVTCDPEVQRARVLARPGMTEEKFRMILSRQLPDVEKRKRADFLIDTGRGFDHARAEVRKIVATLRAKG